MADNIQINLDNRDFTFGKIGTTNRIFLNETSVELDIKKEINIDSSATVLETFNISDIGDNISSIGFNITITNPDRNNTIIKANNNKIIEQSEIYSTSYYSISNNQFINNKIEFEITGQNCTVIINAINYKYLAESTAQISYIPSLTVDYKKINNSSDYINCDNDLFTKIFISKDVSYFIDWVARIVKWENINVEHTGEFYEKSIDSLISTDPIRISNTNVYFNSEFISSDVITVEHEKSSSVAFNDITKQLTDLTSEINNLRNKGRFYQRLFQIGEYYITENKELNPATLFGGTWTLVNDKFLLGTVSSESIGTEGGEKEHVLSIDEMPSHSHSRPFAKSAGKYGENYNPEVGSEGGHTKLNDFPSSTVGEGKAHNNMPPYRYVFLWRKTSNENDPANPQSFATPVTTLYQYVNTFNKIGEIIKFPTKIGIDDNNLNIYKDTNNNYLWLLCNGATIQKTDYPELVEYLNPGGTSAELPKYATINQFKNIGDYHITENNTNPSELFGGSWILVNDRFLLGAPNQNYTGIGSQGGSDILTIDQMPSHRHFTFNSDSHSGNLTNTTVPAEIGTEALNGGWNRGQYRILPAGGDANIGPTSQIGSNQPHKHPYRYVYLWRKITNDGNTPRINVDSPVFTYIRAKKIVPEGTNGDEYDSNPRGITDVKTALISINCADSEFTQFLDLSKITAIRNSDNLIINNIINTINNTQYAELNYDIEFYNNSSLLDSRQFKLYIDFSNNLWKFIYIDPSNYNYYNSGTTFIENTIGSNAKICNNPNILYDLFFAESNNAVLTNKVVSALPLGPIPEGAKIAYVTMELKSFFIKNFIL